MSAIPDFILHAARADRAERSSEVPERSDFAQELVLQQPHLARLVQRLLGWPTENAAVDDIVQESMVSAWTHRAGFRGDSSLKTWLSRIAIHQVRRHQRKHRLLQRLFWGRVDLSAFTATEESDDEGTEQLRRAIGNLRHRDREILVLHYLEGRSVEDVATLLGLRTNTAYARMSRARFRLRQALVVGGPS